MTEPTVRCGTCRPPAAGTPDCEQLQTFAEFLRLAATPDGRRTLQEDPGWREYAGLPELEPGTLDVAAIAALTVTQPWATLIAIGAKRIETRSWATSYRGPLAIHAAKGFPAWARAACQREPVRSVLRAAGIRTTAELPRGMVVAITTLADVARIGPWRKAAWERLLLPDELSVQERAFGDYTPGRFAWRLGDGVHSLAVPARGAQRLWSWSPPAPARAAIAQRPSVRHRPTGKAR